MVDRRSLFFFISFKCSFLLFCRREANVDVESRLIFPNEFLKICELLQSGQQRHFGSTVKALTIRMLAMTRRSTERGAGHFKFHSSDLFLIIAVYSK